MIYNYKHFDLEIKDVDKKEGIVTGYFSAFNIKDADGDTILPGAFSRSIKEWGPSAKGRIKHFLNHDPSLPLGKILDIKEDDYGLWYRSKIGTHSLGRDFIKMVESDLVREHSIGFKDLTPDNKKRGQDTNYITDVKLYEGSSLTSWGANEYTRLVDIKGINTLDIAERIAKFEKFVRDTDATDEAIELCLIHIKQLSQVIETMSSTQPATPAVEQPKESKETVNHNNIDSLKNLFSQWKTLNKS